MHNYTSDYHKIFSKNIELAGAESTLFAEHKAQIVQELVKKITHSPTFILDFGCSDGLLTSFIQAMFTNAQVTGVDQSSEHIEVARMAYAPINFTVATTTIPTIDATYDLVIASDVFHHIPKKKHAHYMQEIMRVLKPGGLCILFELNPLNLFTALNFNRNPLEKNAHMLNHWYVQKLLHTYGPVTTQFHYSSPHWLRRWEKYTTHVPFGALYTCMATKPLRS